MPELKKFIYLIMYIIEKIINIIVFTLFVICIIMLLVSIDYIKDMGG